MMFKTSYIHPDGSFTTQIMSRLEVAEEKDKIRGINAPDNQIIERQHSMIVVNDKNEMLLALEWVRI